MKKNLLKTFAAAAALFAVGVSANAQTTTLVPNEIVVKDQLNDKGSTVEYADKSKTVAYTNANNSIWYLGKYDLAKINKIEIKSAAFVNASNGNKAELKISYYGNEDEVTSDFMSSESGNIRANNRVLAKVVATTTPTTVASSKNPTHYEGADFVIDATSVTHTGEYEGTVELDTENSVKLSKNDGTYNLYVYGTAQSRRLAMDRIIIYTTVTTDISDITAVAPEQTDGAIYNLAGQCVSTPQKGSIYVKNGRKYIAR